MRFVGHALVDWDDTIAENIAYFNQTEEANAALIARLTGHQPEAVRRRGQEIDVATAQRIGLGRESLGLAWVECYREFCAHARTRPDPEAESAIVRACLMPYEVTQELLPGAAEALAWLNGQGFEVTIWTAGDHEVQSRKVRESGLEAYIHRTVIVPDKDPDRLRSALGGRDLARSFVVGNSVRSDIRPALTLGVRAFHVPAETWAYDHGRLDLHDPNYVRLERIGDLPTVLAGRFGAGSQTAD